MRGEFHTWFEDLLGISWISALWSCGRLILFFISIFQLFLLMRPIISTAMEFEPDIANTTEQYNLWKELSDGFDYSIRVLTYGSYLDVAESSQNPDNDFFEIPRYMANLELRPDLYLNFRRLNLSVKPRATLEWSKWEDGGRKGEDEFEDELLINEWLARIGLTQMLFASYGRENLQWGPSYLVSPSNPFFKDNGLSNPIEEIRGKDFARLVWTPSSKWTSSLIANLGEGAQDIQFEEFKKTYAFKLDYTGYTRYSSVIFSYKENDRSRLGFFGGWTASDALLLYGEGNLSKGTDTLYPVEDNDHPFGVTMQPIDEDSSTIKGTVLLGGSYTFLVGPTLTMEYLYNGYGYNDDQAKTYYLLRDNASDAFLSPLDALSRFSLSQTANIGLRFLRQNYTMLQYSHTNIYDIINLVFRWTQNLDDDSGQFLFIFEWDISNHLQLISVGNINNGSQNTEFGTIFDSQWTIGLEYTF